MKPVRSVKNQYRGINAHLHSLLQVDLWNIFHNIHVSGLVAALRVMLLPMGYTAYTEESVQIRRSEEYSRHPRSDITIYDIANYTRPLLKPPLAEQLTGVVVSLDRVLEDNPISEKPYRAVAITRFPDEDRIPIAWIEVLSPSNKRSGEDREAYLQKRRDLLAAKIVFVELDYLHETRSTLPYIPDYRTYEPTSHPYRILMLSPRPYVAEGLASINEFDVDQPIPTVAIPLSDDDVVHFDFDAPYQKQYREMVYGLGEVNYAQFPLNFDTYSEADQTRIANIMLNVLTAAREGRDLETLPFVENLLPLAEALQAIEKMMQEAVEAEK